MHKFDNRASRLLVAFMRSVLTSKSVLAARQLAGFSTAEAASLLGVHRVTLSSIENGAALTERLDNEFRRVYDNLGIEIFGWVDAGTGKAFGEGVRFKGLAATSSERGVSAWIDRDIQSYQVRAGRALLRLSSEGLAKGIGGSRNSVSVVEWSRAHRRDVNARLRGFFEREGLEFLGVVDTATRTLIGGGVRAKLPPDTPVDIRTAASTAAHSGRT